MKVSDEAIIAAVLSNSTNRDAARACGLSEKQFYTRLSQPELKAKLATARTQLLEGAASVIQARVGEAVETMANIMHDKEAPPQTRLNAADGIIRNALKMNETVDIQGQIAELNRAVFQNE